jgi:eukaryotic-like serine/threonine-protein kinase
MTAVSDVLATGQMLGRYRLIRRLAVGGMAEIYLARLPGVGIEGFEKLVVIKRILPQHALDPELLRMFLDEARLSATLTHPHVTEVYDVGSDSEAPFFAMEYVHGANLRELMRAHEKRAAGPLPLEHAIGIVAAAAAGLHYAHEKRGPGGDPLNIVHRDVSPSNVLVSYDGAVKVSDFGIAKWAHQRTQTQEGALKGKFGYMSPEQCRGKALDARSDVFALGTILYELTTSEPPFAAPTDFEILSKIVSGPPEAPRWTGAREYPAALADIVMRALAREPEARTATAQALQVELETFARHERLEVSTVALGAFMQALFADELAAWREAQRVGKSLADHLAERAGRAPARDAARTATDAFGATKRAAPRRRWRRGAVAGVGAAVLATTIALAAHRPPTSGAPLHNGEASAAVAPPAVTAAVESRPPVRDVSTAARTGNNVEAHPASPAPDATPHVASNARAQDKGASRRGARARLPRPAAAPAPSNESRLHAWDPDSPVPP